MSLNSMRRLLKQEAARLYQESVINRIFGRFKYKGRPIFPDDQAKALNGRPLGMFFYNLRAIFLGCGLIFLIVLAVLVWHLPSNSGIFWATVALAIAWGLDAALTIILHESFIGELRQLAHQQQPPSEFPSLFNRYFALDSLIVILLVLVGRWWELSLDAFAFLLFANAVLYSAYFPTARKVNRQVMVLLLFSVLAFLVVFVARIPVGEPRWFYTILYGGLLLGMTFIIVLSVVMISRLRAIEHDTTIRRLELLAAYEDALSSGKAETLNVQQFRGQVSTMLKNLCMLGTADGTQHNQTFWYRSACLWSVEKHRDRGQLLLPAAVYNFPEAESHQDGVPAKKGLLSCSELILMHSIKRQKEKWQAAPDDFRSSVDAPAAFVPLRRDKKRIGVLALYAEEGGPPLQRQDEAFLKSLGSILSNAIEQWEWRYKAQPEREMDDLFEYENLEQVFQRAAQIMKQYLGAEGCMVIFRPNPDEDVMYVKAQEGFSKDIYRTNQYKVGEGLTGKCAATGRPIRIDDVPAHRRLFKLDLLDALEVALIKAGGRPIRSWMAIPIGKRKNYGVIKVINRTSRSTWFSREDMKLGVSLALRLRVIIEKFLFIDQMMNEKDNADKARVEAEQARAEAEAKSREAEALASQRKDDLMVTMHQLQGPLSSMLGSISYLKTTSLTKDVLKLLPYHVRTDVLEELSKLEDFVKDTRALSYGTYTTLALEEGQQASFGMHKINAPEEMRRLASRLQNTNTRADLDFTFYEEPGFPVLRMDKFVFTSVLYSLIHNAMKYADQHSEVSLVCGIERSTGEAVLKVKSIGEPIRLDEREKIFEKFGRGRVTKTGMHHSGVGLGLWVARKLMLAIGGDLTVELSAKEPRLSVFIIHFPNSKSQLS